MEGRLQVETPEANNHDAFQCHATRVDDTPGRGPRSMSCHDHDRNLVTNT